MKFVRYGRAGQERPGVVDLDGHIRDASGLVSDIASDFVASADFARVLERDPFELPLVGGVDRLGPPIARPGKLVCVGLNYTAHAEEVQMAAPPEEPVLFMKAVSAIQGPNDDILIPPGSERVDWEIELGVIIGKRASHIREAEAMDHVAGYCIVNDVSERAHQLEGTGQWVKGKSADTFAPLGPYFVTADELADPHALHMWLEVNGTRMQDSNTANMIRRIPFLIHYISRFMSLLPGDIVATGTPSGVAMSRTPSPWLKAGDVMRSGIAGLGVQSQRVLAWPGTANG